MVARDTIEEKARRYLGALCPARRLGALVLDSPDAFAVAIGGVRPRAAVANVADPGPPSPLEAIEPVVAPESVVPSTADDHVVEGATLDDIVTRPAVEKVVTAPGFAVIPIVVGAGEPVVAAFAEDRIALLGAYEHVVSGSTMDRERRSSR